MSPELLLIDDDVLASALRKRVLERHGYRVQLALDGRSGIALAEALKPELILLDHALPDGLGHEVLRQLRAVVPTTPVVSLSGFDDLASLYNPAPDAFLVKGSGAGQMLSTIEELLR